MPAARVMPSVARRTAPPPGDAETVLMLRVKRDEPGAFAELLDQCRGRTFARLYRTLHDRQEAEDLTQEVFLRLFRARKRWEPRAKFATWLFHITQNVVRNALRARRRHRWLQFGGPVGAADPLADQETRGDRPWKPLECRELAQAVHGAVTGLGSRQRVAFEMQQYQDRSYAEIARALALTPKAAKSLLYRARLHLRDLLQHYVQPD
jgi:RNA polymerase sigma-70 factor (ECF subfamily)